MELFDRRGQPITDWRSWTRPKEEYQWRASRSAMELARAWFTSPVPIVPPEIAKLLQSHALTRDAVLRQGWPERKTALPFRGEGRNHDLVILGEAAGQPMLLAVEGKVDETMGPAVGAYWAKSKRSKGSAAWKRVDALLAGTFGEAATADQKPWSELPYQLLTAAAGAAIEASRNSCGLAVLCVHEFLTESAKARTLARNDKEFRGFLKALGEPAAVPGQLYGPFTISFPRGGTKVSLLVGKAQYRWADRA